ncbi:urease accessory protein UreF [Flexibacterium corallicola]|uniref:urease accessory protein UreF n=1 Tax=Flexibacterium corallicola TaxID=3037259 RepID=UPI00286EF780|nr:urease accessory protein UreF [Pseudovibrio sp. M1P-2-3]
MSETGLSLNALLQLQTWLSPAFPIGAFSYSHGLETAVHLGKVHERTSAEAWLEALLFHGSGHNDVIMLCQTWRAASKGEWEEVRQVNDLALAMAPSKERYQETAFQGSAFLSAAEAWIDELPPLLTSGPVALPVAAGVVTAHKGIPLEAAAGAFVQAFIANLVSMLVRHMPLGQSEGLKLLHALEPKIARLVQDTKDKTLDDLGGAAIISDIASMAHELLRTRIYKS